MHSYHSKHKNEHNRQKIGDIPKSIMSKLWSIIDSSLELQYRLKKTESTQRSWRLKGL